MKIQITKTLLAMFNVIIGSEKVKCFPSSAVAGKHK